MRAHVLQDGSTIGSACSFTLGFKRKLARRGRRATHHMRVGRYSVTTLDDDTLVVAIEYDGLCDDGSIRPGSRFWASHVSDRLRQLAHVEARVAGHPLEVDVRADIREEHVHLATLEGVLS